MSGDTLIKWFEEEILSDDENSMIFYYFIKELLMLGYSPDELQDCLLSGRKECKKNS